MFKTILYIPMDEDYVCNNEGPIHTLLLHFYCFSHHNGMILLCISTFLYMTIYVFLYHFYQMFLFTCLDINHVPNEKLLPL